MQVAGYMSDDCNGLVWELHLKGFKESAITNFLH